MIKSISIENIQSHKQTTLDFHDGVNVIVGSSNSGKTAILRSLFWVRYNRPSGSNVLCSHWALDKKGNICDAMKVTLVNEKGTVIRSRDKASNGYTINGKELQAVRTDVPQDVLDLLALSETNIQQQQDAPFLLSLSNADVARYFNRIVRLDIIDKVLSNAESTRKKLKQTVDSNQKQLARCELQMSELDWTDNAEVIFSKYAEKKNELETLEARLAVMEKSIEEAYSHRRTYKALESVIAQKGNTEKLKELLFEKKTILDKYSDVVCSLSNYTDFEKIKDKYKASISAKALAVRVLSLAKTNKQKQDRIGVVDGLLYEYERSSKSVISMDKEKKLLVRINKLLARHSSLLDEYENIDNGIYETNLVAEKILSYQETIDENKKLLPEICPLCGGKL